MTWVHFSVCHVFHGVHRCSKQVREVLFSVEVDNEKYILNYAQKSTFLPDALEINVSFRSALVKAFLDKTSAKTSTSFQLISSTARVKRLKSQQQVREMVGDQRLKCIALQIWTPVPTSTKKQNADTFLLLLKLWYMLYRTDPCLSMWRTQYLQHNAAVSIFFVNRQDRIVTTTNASIIYH